MQIPILAAVLVFQTEAEHVTFAEVLSNIPHDPASIFVYLLLVASVVGVVVAGRARKGEDGGSP